MNKRGTYYKALEIDGILDAILPGHGKPCNVYNSIEDVKKVIDADNEDRKRFGLPTKQSVIAMFYWERNYNPDGTFKELIETTTAIEIYPKE